MTRRLEQATVTSQRRIITDVYEIILKAPSIARSAVPGQFIHLKVNNLSQPLLRRPISIAGIDSAAGTLTLIYRVIGQGTELLSRVCPGDQLDCLGPLGCGFNLEATRPLLIGGGMGLAPLAGLAGQLCPRPTTVLMGGRTKEELFWEEIFQASCQSIHITSDDGSIGAQGFTVDVLPRLLATEKFDQIYTCGPQPMMKQVAQIASQHNIPCQVSLEEYMACGIGGCLACTCAGTDGKRRKVCTEGPVFWAQEVFG